MGVSGSGKPACYGVVLVNNRLCGLTRNLEYLDFPRQLVFDIKYI